jgi:hypothetical protein
MMDGFSGLGLWEKGGRAPLLPVCLLAESLAEALPERFAEPFAERFAPAAFAKPFAFAEAFALPKIHPNSPPL